MGAGRGPFPSARRSSVFQSEYAPLPESAPGNGGRGDFLLFQFESLSEARQLRRLGLDHGS